MKPLFVIFADNWNQIGVAQGDQSGLMPLPRAFKAESTEPASIEQEAKAVAAALESQGYDGGGIMLAIPSAWCLCATIPIADLPKRNRRPLMVYRLEEHLPLAAEDLVVDFTTEAPLQNRVMGIAVVLSQLKPVLAALEKAGIWVRSISPSAMLVLQEIKTERGHEAPPMDAWLLVSEDGFEVLVFDRVTGQIDEWSTQKDQDAVRIELRRLALLRPAPLTVGICGVDAAEALALTRDGDVDINYCSIELPANEKGGDRLALAVIRASAQILSGDRAALVELRRDALAEPEPLRQVRAPLSLAIGAAVLFCLSLAGSLLLRAQAYSSVIDEAQIQEQKTYREALGKPPMGPNIKARLVSEDRRLAALSGTLGTETAGSTVSGGKQPSLPQPVSSLLLLRDTLKSLPQDLRYRLLDLRFTSDGIELGGECRAHGDADAIAGGLRSIGGYAVDPPHSETRGQGGAMDKGVSFTINARLIHMPTASGAQP